MSLGSIVKIVGDMRAEMRAAGADQPAIDAATERVVKANWPTEREWKYLCQTCRDYGLEMFECPGDSTCGRDQPHGPHDFGRPCWCSAGQKFRAKSRAETDWQEAAKVQKPKPSGWTRPGR